LRGADGVSPGLPDSRRHGAVHDLPGDKCQRGLCKTNARNTNTGAVIAIMTTVWRGDSRRKAFGLARRPAWLLSKAPEPTQIATTSPPEDAQLDTPFINRGGGNKTENAVLPGVHFPFCKRSPWKFRSI